MTPTPTPLEQLALKCETASGPDREFDLAIHVALHPDGDIACVMGNRRGFDSKDGLAWDICGASVCYERYTDGRCWANGGYPLPAYSASLDAAMTLVPEGYAVTDFMIWPGVPAKLSLLGTAKRRFGIEQTLQWVHAFGDGKWSAEAATPALALTAAALRARAALAKEPTR